MRTAQAIAAAEALDAADLELTRAEERARAAAMRQTLTARPGVAYGLVDHDAGTYLVTQDGEEIGHLHHTPGTAFFRDWTALIDGRQLGPFVSPRLALKALLDHLRDRQTRDLRPRAGGGS
jgi:hypothetical protein